MSAIWVDIAARRGSFILNAAFEAPPSGVMGVFGPSGGGKTTLALAMTGLTGLDRGVIRIGARTLDDRSAGVRTPTHKRGVGLMFQDPRLFPHLTVHGNLAFALKRAPRTVATIEEAAAWFDADALLARPVHNLSGGEAARVALARAVLSAPDLLILDEPFAALDRARRLAFSARLATLSGALGVPIWVVSHQIDELAGVCDALVIVDGGRVTASGPFAEVALSPACRAVLSPEDVGAAMAADALVSADGDGSPRRVWLRANDVILATQEPAGLSARNIIEARVEALELDPPGAALVFLSCASGRLAARVTQSAAQELALAPGRQVWAVAKAMAT